MQNSSTGAVCARSGSGWWADCSAAIACLFDAHSAHAINCVIDVAASVGCFCGSGPPPGTHPKGCNTREACCTLCGQGRAPPPAPMVALNATGLPYLRTFLSFCFLLRWGQFGPGMGDTSTIHRALCYAGEVVRVGGLGVKCWVLCAVGYVCACVK